MVCHADLAGDARSSGLQFLSCHHQEWYATETEEPLDHTQVVFLSCHHQEWYATEEDDRDEEE